VPAPPLVSRVEVRLGLAFWLVAGVAAALTGAFWDWLAYAAAPIALVAAWPVLRRQAWAEFVLDWLPLPFVVFTYEMLHRVVPVCWRGTFDAPFAAADRTILGDHAAVLLEPIVSRPLTTAMACFYASYYPLTISLAVWFYVRRRRTAFREYCAGEVGALFIGYLGYLFLPTLGPHAALPAETWSVPLDGDFIGPAIRALNGNHHGAFPRDAFPSLHTANAVTILLVTWRHDRRLFGVYLVPCLGLVAATVYLRWHYAVDVAAGAALAVAWQAFVPRFVARESAPDAGPAPSCAGSGSL
jgi:membrane-associated phospholipid phosphatase